MNFSVILSLAAIVEKSVYSLTALSHGQGCLEIETFRGKPSERWGENMWMILFVLPDSSGPETRLVLKYFNYTRK